MFVKTGDKVKVIAGKDKGKEGTVLSVNAKTNRIVVKGVNKIKKHEKPSQTNANGGVVEKEGSIHASNVKVIAKKEDNNMTSGTLTVSRSGYNYTFTFEGKAIDYYTDPGTAEEKPFSCSYSGPVTYDESTGSF